LTDLRLDAGKHRKQRRTGWRWQLKGNPMHIESAVNSVRLNSRLLLIAQQQKPSRQMLIHLEHELFGMVRLAQALRLPAASIQALADMRWEVAQHLIATAPVSDLDPDELPF
jgi:hypothetical protein